MFLHTISNTHCTSSALVAKAALLLFSYNQNFVHSRATPTSALNSRTIQNSTFQIEILKNKNTTLSDTEFIRFEDSIANQHRKADGGIYFPTDAERQAELHSRHSTTDWPKLDGYPEAKVLNTSRTVELGSSDFSDSAEALEEFIDWVTEKGVPDSVLAAIDAKASLNPNRTTKILIHQFSIAVGNILPCENEDHVMASDGSCRPRIEF